MGLYAHEGKKENSFSYRVYLRFFQPQTVFIPPPRDKKIRRKENTISLPGFPKKWGFIQLQLPNIICKPAVAINGELGAIKLQFIWFFLK